MTKAIGITISMISTTDLYSGRKKTTLNLTGIQSVKNDVCEEINRLNGVAEQIKAPQIDISSWQSIFNSLRECGEWAIVENENEEIFHIGIILKAGKNKLTMREFDADGKWQEETKIPYKEITSVSFKTRYIDNWRKYLERTKEG